MSDAGGGVAPKPMPAAGGNSFGAMLEGKIGKPNGEVAPLDPTAAGFGRLPVGGRAEILSMVRAAAQKNGVDPVLFQALIQQESDFDPKCLSGAGAMGLAQLMPGTARALGVSDPYDPQQSLDGGARYFSQMMKQFGDVKLALAAYNAGPGAVRRAGGVPDYAETKAYVQKIMANVDKLRSGGVR
ncbi:MAG: lytic transglycosylase domain-containing protein [Armatimonadetes bacterium]|nr:lytic transglycosylase domain-containing protein [Armatimonadota bacterium]